MVQAMININEHANRVLNIVKAKFGLKDKSEAINKFVEIFGEEVEQMNAKDEYVKKIIQICNEHFKKHPNRSMSLRELDKLCEAK